MLERPTPADRVEFKCDEDNAMLGFTEMDKCSYLMKFQTPAACT